MVNQRELLSIASSNQYQWVIYKNARSLPEEKYVNPHYIVAAYRKEIKSRQLWCVWYYQSCQEIRERNGTELFWTSEGDIWEPDFADLIHFVDDEATLTNDPLFSKDALSGYVDRKEAPSKRWQLKTYLATVKEKSGKSKDACYPCQNNHDLDKCQEYMKKSVEERSIFLFQKKLCCGCYIYANIDRS